MVFGEQNNLFVNGVLWGYERDRLYVISTVGAIV